jgi:hypothetical protein
MRAGLAAASPSSWRTTIEARNAPAFKPRPASRPAGGTVAAERWIAPPGPDQGIDVIAYTDPLGTKTHRIKVQVKRQATTKIAVDGLRAFMAVLGDQDVGIFISAGGFTSEAQREARAQERRSLTLIDLDRLTDSG